MKIGLEGRSGIPNAFFCCCPRAKNTCPRFKHNIKHIVLLRYKIVNSVFVSNTYIHSVELTKIQFSCHISQITDLLPFLINK